MLDQLSADILSLERYLDGSGLRIPCHVEVSATEELRWCRGEPRRWRVVYAGPAMTRALIETPAAIRLRARRALPELLRAAGRAAAECLEKMQ